jgi:hypothetical protein
MTIPPWYRASLEASERIASLNVFFIVGCQKSGTTWLARLLDGHPEAACRGEAHFADVLAPMMLQAVKGYTGVRKTCGHLDGDAIWSAVRMLADRILISYVAAHPERTITAVGDKTPEGAIAIEALAQMYPGARFIHIIRDGRDGAVSGWAHLKREGNDDRFGDFAEYAAYFAKSHWTNYIGQARRAAAALAGRCLEVRYEALHADAASETRRLLEFLALDASDESVQACLDAGAFERLTGGRHRGEEQPDSHFRKGLVGDWVNHFDAESLAAFESIAGPLMDELGYERAVAAPV